MILDLQPEWVATDEAFTVKCHVPSVAPLQSLTLTLLQGDQELHRKDFLSLSLVSQRAEVTVSVRAHRENDRHNFSCLAELDLSPQGGGLFHGSSATKQLRIFGESEPSREGSPGPALPFGTLFPHGLGVRVTEAHLWLTVSPVPSHSTPRDYGFPPFSFPITWQNSLRIPRSRCLRCWKLGKPRP